jgi:hypothetical protein
MSAGEGHDNVIDLTDWRAHRRPDPIPAEALAEVEAAARTYDALLAQGHEVRFELPRDGGRVKAELRSLDGRLVRPVSLTEILGLDGGPAPSAA